MKFAEEQPTRQKFPFHSYIFYKLEAAISSWKHGFTILSEVLIQHCKWKPFHFKSRCQFVSKCAFIPVRHRKAVNAIQLVIYSQCSIYTYSIVISGLLQKLLGFFLLIIIAHNLPSLHSRSGMLQGVIWGMVLQLTNRLITHKQKALKRFCHSFIFPFWLIQCMEGLFGATITLSKRYLLRTLETEQVQLCSLLLKSKYSQRNCLHSYDTHLHIFLSIGEGEETWMWGAEERVRDSEEDCSE